MRVDTHPSESNRRQNARVHMQYTVECYGEPRSVELPFVVGVLADLSGKPAEPLPAVGDRKFLEIYVDSFDYRLKACKPRVAFQVPNRITGEGDLSVEMTFEGMDDFLPSAVARKVEPLKRLLLKRAELARQFVWQGDLPEARPLVAKVLNDPDLSAAISPRLLSELAAKTAEALGAEIDRLLTEQVNYIIHHPDFQSLEATWRGFHYLVSTIVPDEAVKIRVLNISKQELGKTLKKFEGTAWDQSPIFKKLYNEEYSTAGGAPYGCVVGDYYFDHSPEDVKMLGNIAQIAAAAHAPFIAGAAPSVMNMESWQELSGPRDLTKIFQTEEYASWRSLRDSDDSRYIGLAMPRFLARLPYGAKTVPVEEFAFEEDTAGADHKSYTWSNAAYAMAKNLAQAFQRYGWWGKLWGLQGGGIVEKLAPYQFETGQGLSCTKWPVEVITTDRRAEELKRLGLNILQYHKAVRCGVFSSAVSLYRAPSFEEPSLTEVQKLYSDLRYLLPVCRCIHYLKAMVRDSLGRFMDKEGLERFLNEWIRGYVLAQHDDVPEETRARFPLAAAEIKVVEIPGAPGSFSLRCRIRPHFQLEEPKESLSARATVPSSVFQAEGTAKPSGSTDMGAG